VEAERQQVPVFVFCPRILPEIEKVARAHPGLQLIVDHFGLPQPPLMDADPEPFETLPQLLAMAELPNVAVKFSGAPTLSKEPFPFVDLWPHLRQVVDAFGPERLIWASDYQRVKDHTYAEALAFVRDTDELTDEEKEWILGKAARRVLRWERSDA
jgi:predicted TIM-barrel fold metal-dependent hydrolase